MTTAKASSRSSVFRRLGSSMAPMVVVLVTTLMVWQAPCARGLLSAQADQLLLLGSQAGAGCLAVLRLGASALFVLLAG
ncbi:hypothetical protein GCM10010215_11470 [Streptomyces virginiae]|nr:hypothetical protein GCM10010215_11470 [Streptomyces virginiae]